MYQASSKVVGDGGPEEGKRLSKIGRRRDELEQVMGHSGIETG